MRVLMASSNVNGCNETGFAFGIVSPRMAKVTEHFLLCTSSENASAAAFSASCYHIGKNIRILSVVMPERKFREVQWQILFAHLVVRAHNSTLQERPKGVNVGRVNIPANVFMRAVCNEVMREFWLEVLVTACFVGRYQRHISADSFSHKAIKRFNVGALNHLTNDIALAANSTDDGNLARGSTPAYFLIPVAVFILSPDISFVNLYFAMSLANPLSFIAARILWHIYHAVR